MSCPSGYFEVDGSPTYGHEVTAYTTLGFTLFIWRHEIDWDYSYCVEDCTQCIGDIADETVSNYEGNSWSEFTDVTWSYDGNVSSDIDHYPGASLPNFTSFRQDLYTGPEVVGFPTGSANPSSELEGDAFGGGTTNSATNY